MHTHLLALLVTRHEIREEAHSTSLKGHVVADARRAREVGALAARRLHVLRLPRERGSIGDARLRSDEKGLVAAAILHCAEGAVALG